MKELIAALSAGWHQYADGGMYVGIFFAALLFLWLLCYKDFKKTGRNLLFLYAIGIGALVLCPVTAFILLKYQTAFFTYSQLFLLFPMLPVIAWAMTELVTLAGGDLLKQSNPPKYLKQKTWICEILVVLVLAMVLCLGGNLSFANTPQKGIGGVHAGTLRETENAARIPNEVLQVLQMLQTKEEINLEEDVIVAPDEVLEYARAYSADFRLLYGRNMWQPALGAYTYDIYPVEVEQFHQWLNSIVYGLFAVDTNISVERAAEILVNNDCTVVVFTKVQYAEEEIAGTFAEYGFRFVTETPEYAILKR